MAIRVPRPLDVRKAVDAAGKAVGAAGKAIGAALDTRHKPITAEMLNSAGSVSAEWYIETLWHYLHKKAMLQGVRSFDVQFKQPARLGDRQLHFTLPHPDQDALVMDFHVLRADRGARTRAKVPVAHIAIHRGSHRRRHGVAPEPPAHPYGIEIRERHLNSARQVSWYTLVAVIMDVARRGLQFDDPRDDRLDPHLLYVVPRFSFTPLSAATAQPNLFVYPEFAVEQPWTRGKTSATARVTYWAVANEAPWPLVESVVTVVRTSLVNGVRRPVDDSGRPVAKAAGAS
ncbi:MAG: hypothetical protein AB7U83_03170 [Vicinamibacterales bacterium]